MKVKTKPKSKGSAIEYVNKSDKGIEVMFSNVRLVYDGISEVIESPPYEGHGPNVYRFVAGLEIPDTKEVRDLISQIRKFFKDLKISSWSGDVALEHFDKMKFKPSRDEGMLLLYPTAPAEQVEGGFQAKGKLFVNPDHSAFYAGCYVDAKVAFVANTRGTIVIKDYLNGIKFVDDGEPISGASDPWGNSQAKATISNVRSIEKKEEEPAKSTRRPVKRK